MIDSRKIEEFLHGSDPQKYIVAIEAEYNKPEVTLVINDPEKGKYLEQHKYQPFLWFKEDVTKMMYGGKRMEILNACSKHNVKITKLRTHDETGYIPPRMENGFKYLVKCKGSYNNLINFFMDGGVDVFDKNNKNLFILFSPIEQFLIQTGKRLFKGFDDYNDLHRFQFDLETEGLNPNKDAIFQIGFRNNKGLEYVLESNSDDLRERREKERLMIGKFFKVIEHIEPDIISGYNSENFDWGFLFSRAEKLNMNISELAITLNRISKIKRKPATLKLGGETEHYTQTHMYGYNITDISHAVRRAMAINSEIKSWGLKYITQYSGISKPNRVYIQGDKINTIWADKVNKYAFNDENGDWYRISDRNTLKIGYKEVSGAYIVQRYLKDDLWETEQIDYIYNQASFLLSKMLPTTFMRSSTMGTAGQWKLFMSAWSYQNNLAIPETQPKRDFTGGLSRLLQVGYAKDVVKFDFAALYPKTQLTWDIFPDLDISGVMKGILTYVVDTRDHFKFLTGVEKDKVKTLQKKLDKEKDNLSDEEIQSLKKQIAEHKSLSGLYDKKQLPLKILANSWFGSYGAPYIFNWGDTDSAEETTCRGRQSLRLMVRHFTEKHGFKPLVLDTDGCNFSFPKNIGEFKYVARGSHWKTKDDAGKELFGLDAVLAEFNENYMEGRMGLDIDDIYNATINFARKNYANDNDGKIKLVGNSIKSKKTPFYIEEFLNTAIRMLLDGDGESFINYYYSYVDKIYNYKIPLVKIASKAKVKTSVPDYKKKRTMKNKAGNPMPKQAHMELVINNNLSVNLGDVIYYVNTGTSKSHGDLKTVDKNKMTKKEREKYFNEHGEYPKPNKVTELNCRLIDTEIVERDFEYIKELELLNSLIEGDGISEFDKTEYKKRINELNESLFVDDYNVDKYLDSFNKKVKPLLVCFKPEVRDRILLKIKKVKNKETKTTIEKLDEKAVFTAIDCELISGVPFKESQQDSYEDLMTMEDKEIKFWLRVGKTPNYITETEWVSIKEDYLIRLEKERQEGIIQETKLINEIFSKMEVSDILNFKHTYILPLEVFSIADLSNDNDGTLISRKWGANIGNILDILKYEKSAIKRHEFYLENNLLDDKDKFDKWLDTQVNNNISFDDINLDGVFLKETNNIIDVNKEFTDKINKSDKKNVDNEDIDDEDVDDEDIDEETFNEDIILDDEFDDTYADKPDDYIVKEKTKTSIIEDDGWLF